MIVRRLPRLLVAAALTSGLVSFASTAHAEPLVDTSTTTAGPIYSVDCSLAMNGDGSTAAPWNSLADIAAHGPFAPGDRIQLRRGTTCTGAIRPQGSGTAAAPIVLGAYDTGALPIVNGNSTPNGTGTVLLVNQQHWTVQDLHLTNRGAATTSKTYRSAVMVRNVHGGRLSGVTVQRLQIDNVVSYLGGWEPRSYGGISVLTSGTSGDGFDGTRILDNRITGVGRSGIMSANGEEPKGHDRDLRIASNTVRSVQGDSIVALGVVGARIDHNLSANGARAGKCAQCGKLGPRTAHAGIWPIRSSSVVIEYNEVYGENAAGGDGEAFDIDRNATGVILQYNYAHDNDGGGVLLCGSKNATVRFNIFENNKKSAIAFIGTFPAKNSAIYNNTIYSSAKSGAGVVRYFNGARGSGISFKNNLVYDYASATYHWPTKKVTTAANTLIGRLAAGRPTDAKTSHVNPQLKRPGTGGNGFSTLKGYQPKHPSTFKRGVAIPSSVKIDFFGRKINPKKPPRGAAG